MFSSGRIPDASPPKIAGMRLTALSMAFAARGVRSGVGTTRFGGWARPKIVPWA